jgi:hypothetical protein
MIVPVVPFVAGFVFFLTIDDPLTRRPEVVATDTFEAPSDDEAMQIAWTVWDVCDDFCSGFGLWEHGRFIADHMSPRPFLTTDSRRNSTILALQEALVAGYSRLRTSAKLMSDIQRRRAARPN